MNEECCPMKQYEKDGKFYVGLKPRFGAFAASSDGIVEKPSSNDFGAEIPPKIQFATGDGIPIPAVNGPALMALIQEVVRKHVGGVPSVDSHIIAVYVIGTFCHQLFPSFPDLWLYVPSVVAHEQVRRLFQSLAFNCFRVDNLTSVEACYKVIQDYTPTLLLEDPRHRGGMKWRFLTQAQSRKDRKILQRYLEKHPSFVSEHLKQISVYCPRVTVSSKLPPRVVQRHTIPIPLITEYVDSGECAEIYPVVQGQILAFTMNLANAVREEIARLSATVPTEDLRFPVLAISNVLINKGALGADDHSAIVELLERTRQCIRWNCEVDEDELVLMFVADYIQDPSKSTDGFHVLETMVGEMHNLGIGLHLSPWSLSRFLNRRKLVSEWKRPRIENLGKGKTLQRAAVKIDIAQLKRVTPYVTW